MGVRCLTSLFNERRFYDNYKLSNCHLIIDGMGLASAIYRNVCSNPAFGGDYDKFAICVEWCIKEFKLCGVVPVVVFGGICTTEDISTRRQRLESKILSYAQLGPLSQPEETFPLILKQAFMDKLVEHEIAHVQCDRGCYPEMVALAKKLDCPVLGHNSDFLIYNVRFIPLRSFPFSSPSVVRGKPIPCIIYRVDLFLEAFNMTECMLPLLAALVNTHNKHYTEIQTFFDSLNVKTQPFNYFQILIDVIIWLSKESFDSALKKVCMVI
jgi:hypothetical protein